MTPNSNPTTNSTLIQYAHAQPFTFFLKDFNHSLSHCEWFRFAYSDAVVSVTTHEQCYDG